MLFKTDDVPTLARIIAIIGMEQTWEKYHSTDIIYISYYYQNEVTVSPVYKTELLRL